MKKPKIQDFEKMIKKKKKAGDHDFTYVYQKPQSDSILRYGVTQIFLSYRAISCPLPTPPPPPNTSENQNFGKMKKASGDGTILNLCNKKHNQMMYAY